MLKKEDIKYLIIHCSDTPNTLDLSAKDIHKMHIDFGWDGIGYHKIIKRDGSLENGRPEFWIGAHTYGLNDKSLGICLIGRDEFTRNQYNTLELILKNLKDKYISAQIRGHCESIKTNKTCPNFNVSKWCKERNLI